jgi:hypothetical protein
MTLLEQSSQSMQELLFNCTGLSEQDRKLLTYWALGTHALPSLREYPLLNLLGKSHTGKSTSMDIISLFSRKPIRLSLRGTTGAMIRDRFVEAMDGTIIVEESDAAWRDLDSRFEQLLSDRFSRRTAEESHKEQIQAGRNLKWGSKTSKYFGATVCHRRKPFIDIALDNRSLTVKFTPVYRNEFSEAPTVSPVSLEGFVLDLPVIKKPEDVAGRVFTTHRSILGIARLLNDINFELFLHESMRIATENLKEGQQTEPDSVVLSAIAHVLYGTDYLNRKSKRVQKIGNVKISQLRTQIESEDGHDCALDSRQIGKVCRDLLGFSTIKSNGNACVFIVDELAFFASCQMAGYRDEVLEERHKYICEDSSTSSTDDLEDDENNKDKPN